MYKQALAAISAFIIAASGAAADQLLLHKNGRQVQVVSQTALGTKSKREFRNWRKDPNYFGVLVFNSAEDGVYGSARGVHSLKQARSDAMALCRAESDTSNGCYEYAYSLPRGYDPNKSGTTIGQGAQKAFQGPFTKRQKAGTFGAFAIDDGFSYGWAVNRSTAAAAQEQAQLACEAGAADARADTPAEIRKTLNLNNRLKCRVIYVSQKP